MREAQNQTPRDSNGLQPAHPRPWEAGRGQEGHIYIVSCQHNTTWGTIIQQPWLSKCHKNTGTVTLEVSAWRWQVTTESSAPLCDWQLKSNALGKTQRQSSVRQKVWSVSSHCLDLRLRSIPCLKFEKQLFEASTINLKSAFVTLISVECPGK